MRVTKKEVNKAVSNLRFDPYAKGITQALVESGLPYLRERFREQLNVHLNGGCDMNDLLKLGILIKVKEIQLAMKNAADRKVKRDQAKPAT